jgi:hypothetical protein
LPITELKEIVIEGSWKISFNICTLNLDFRAVLILPLKTCFCNDHVTFKTGFTLYDLLHVAESF